MKMRPADRRRLLMLSYGAQAKRKRHRADEGRKGKSHMDNDLELTIATDGAGVSRILTAEPRGCGVCGFPRTLFVSRNGRTRCYECDHGFCKAEAEMVRQGLGISA